MGRHRVQLGTKSMSAAINTVELEKERSLLAAIVNSSDDAIASKTLDGTITTWNRAAERLFGYAAPEVIGMPMTILFPADRLDEERMLLARIARGESVHHYETVRVRKDGSALDVSVTLSPIFDRKGCIVGASKIARDISGRRRAEATARECEFRSLAEALPQIVWITRADGWNIYFNQSWVEYTGLTLEESHGHGWNKPFHPEDQQRAWDAWQNAVNNHGIYSLECRLRRADGEYRWWLVRGVPQLGASGAIERWFGTCTDIHDLTWRQQVEIDLRAAKIEADRASLAKSKFLAAASHDLRQPVQSLVLFLSIVKAHANTPVVAKAASAMENALEGLNGLLTSILDISRIDAGVVAPQMQGVDVGGLVLRLASEYAHSCEQKGLRLRCRSKPGLHARTDAALLERVIRNLIENAIRYTDCGGLLIGARHRGDRLRIDVIDTGIGIPADKLPKIYDEFYQVANTARDAKQGLGLGLSIVSRLAQLIGAEVQVRSNPGRGTRFSVSLPRAAASLEVSSPSTVAEIVTGQRILVIEDNPTVRMGLQLLLEGWNCEVVSAETGEEALNAGERDGWRFDAVIADHRLGPGLSGTETAAEIRRRSGRPIPTLIVTGDTASERIEEVHASGFEMMHKPVTPNELARKMAQLLRG